MRTLTGPELTTLQGVTYQVGDRIKVANGSGTMIDLSSWVENVSFNADIDRPASALTVQFRRDFGTTLSLAPLRTDSTLNRLDNGTDYSPQLDAGRVITWESTTTPLGTAPVEGDHKLLFKGYIDVVDFDHSPITVSTRDEASVLVDRFIESEVDYGSAVGVALETVKQQVLDATFGASFIPLYTPVTPNYAVSPPYTQQRQSMMDAMQALAQLPGWDSRYWWHEGTLTRRFTLQNPPRTKTTPDYTFGPSGYFDITRLSIDRANIRNVITVSYYESSSTARKTVTVSDSASITKYGRRTFYIQESDTSPIDTTAEATTMANAALADLKDPKAEAEIECPFFWPVELWDLLRFSANGVHVNSDQDWAVVSISHKLSRTQHRTILTVRGSVAGGYLTWLDRGGIAGEARPGEISPTALISVVLANKHESLVKYSVRNGTSPFQYQRRIDVAGLSTGTYSAYATLTPGGVTEIINADRTRLTRVYQLVKDATGLVSDEAHLTIDPYITPAEGAGHGSGQAEEEQVRGGGGGYGAPARRYRTEPGYDETGSVLTWDPVLRRHHNAVMHSTIELDLPTGVLGAATIQSLAGSGRTLMKGFQSGYVKDGVAATFSPVFQNVPAIRIFGGLAPNATYPYDDIAAESPTASGFTCRARIRNKGTVTARTAEFTSPLTTSSVGGTVGPATLASAPAVDNNYRVRGKLTVVCITDLEFPSGSSTVVAAVEVSADGTTGWTEYATESKTVSRTTGGTTTTSFTIEKTVNVPSLTGSSKARWKLKSITYTGIAEGTPTLEGFDNSPGSEGHGVEYTTATGSTNISKTPDADDYMAWEAYEATS